MKKTGWSNYYRPKDLKTYTGNAIVKRKIENMISSNRLPQTLLLSGERGCGKTTLARIIAKMLICETPEPNGSACGSCAHCQQMNDNFIAKGNVGPSLNVNEVDITHCRGINEAKDLIAKMRIKPLGNQKKIYILDEVQLATPEAQNAFLKISEEPNSYLYIIMCTTEPEKLITPFKSRFTSMKIRKPATNELLERLEEICMSENVAYETSALLTLISHYQRVPREAIKALETTSVGGKITYDKVIEELQIVSSELYRKYFKLLGKDIFETMQFIDSLYEEHNVDWSDFLSNLADYTLDLFNMKLGMRLEKYTESQYKEAKSLLHDFSTNDIGRFLGLIEDALKMTNDPRYALTMLTLKMGYEDVLKPEKVEEVPRAIAKEEAVGVQSYVDNKVEVLKEKDKQIARTPTKIEDLLAVFNGEAEVVDITPDEYKQQKQERQEKQINLEDGMDYPF